MGGGASAGTSEADTPVDAVVTWVDGEDAAWQAALRRYSGRDDDPQRRADGPRYRDNGFLRYCLRSLRRNMPWLRRIHLVTEGHLPRWLDPGAKGVATVAHHAIFADPAHLPVFNSRAIETHLHRIPGLSETFLYFNDDFFVLRPVPRERFVTSDGGHVVPLERVLMPHDPTRSHANDRSLAFTQLVLNRRFGQRQGRRSIPHIGYPLSRAGMQHIWAVWPDDLARTSANRFCMTNSISLQALYYYALLEWPGDALPAFMRERSHPVATFEGPEYKMVMTLSGLAGLRRDMATVAAVDATFLCVNDDTKDPRVAVEEAAFMADWLEERFPDPAPWERALPTRRPRSIGGRMRSLLRLPAR